MCRNNFFWKNIIASSVIPCFHVLCNMYVYNVHFDWVCICGRNNLSFFNDRLDIKYIQSKITLFYILIFFIDEFVYYFVCLYNMINTMYTTKIRGTFFLIFNFCILTSYSFRWILTVTYNVRNIELPTLTQRCTLRASRQRHMEILNWTHLLKFENSMR